MWELRASREKRISSFGKKPVERMGVGMDGKDVAEAVAAVAAMMGKIQNPKVKAAAKVVHKGRSCGCGGCAGWLLQPPRRRHQS